MKRGGCSLVKTTFFTKGLWALGMVFFFLDCVEDLARLCFLRLGGVLMMFGRGKGVGFGGGEAGLW